jgi:lactoylglutathione lyase
MIRRREECEYTPKEGFILAHFLTVANVKRSADFYLHVFGGKLIRSGEPIIIQPTVGLF